VSDVSGTGSTPVFRRLFVVILTDLSFFFNISGGDCCFVWM
jgi:hypothetical protein